MLASNFPPRTSTPAKSLSPSALASNLVTGRRPGEWEGLETVIAEVFMPPLSGPGLTRH
jgi:hypothetical protein